MAENKTNEKKALIELAESFDENDYNTIIEILKRNNLLKINK